MPIAQIFLARMGAGAFERTFSGDSEFDPAGKIELDARVNGQSDPIAACEAVFAICNSYPNEMHVDGIFLDAVKAYRAGGHRSLSVGDVVAFGECFWFCASSGWTLVERPSHNLMAAFILDNRAEAS